MNSILRESGQGFISDILEFTSNFNPGLLKTKAKYFDEFYKKRPFYTSKEIATLFGNIPEIKEDIWVIVIDEIERAPFNEVYRLTEIIERFKNEGRSGVPIKLIFISVSRATILRDSWRNTHLKILIAYRPREFFLQDQKSITQPLFLPPVDINILVKYIIKNAEKVRSAEKINDGINLEEVYINTISNPSRNFMAKPLRPWGMRSEFLPRSRHEQFKDQLADYVFSTARSVIVLEFFRDTRCDSATCSLWNT